MKFSAAATAFLACTVSIASVEGNSPTDLFGLGEALETEYDDENNRFTLKFTAGTSTKDDQAFSAEYYDYDTCATTKYSSSEITLEKWGFGNDDAIGFAGLDDPAPTYPVHQFDLDMAAIKNSDMWSENGADSEIKFCARSIIGTADDGSTDGIEVNFFETQIIVKIDLTSDVTTDVVVQKRDPTKASEETETYTVECFICQAGGDAGGKGSSTSVPAKQGEMVNVCMRPVEDDIAISSLKSFAWIRNSEQQVVVSANAPDTAANPLSTDPTCNSVSPPTTKDETCGFSSMMRASFYDDLSGNSQNTVIGEGEVLLSLNRRNRRLNEIDVNDARTQRLLQGVGGEVSVSVPLSNEDTGPGSLKTAGGASLGTALASGIALLGAVLFA